MLGVMLPAAAGNLVPSADVASLDIGCVGVTPVDAAYIDVVVSVTANVT